jgi:hypothetical protein
MAIHDVHRYFDKAWGRHWINVVVPSETRVLEAYGVDLAGLADRYGFNVVREHSAKEP